MNKEINLTGRRFGRLICLRKLEGYLDFTYRCKCDCGNEKNVKAKYLRAETIKSCGCLRVETSRAKRHDLTVRWFCKCDCGETKSIRAGNLISKTITSCGCVLKRKGSDSPSWKGGKHNKDGYVVLYQGKEKRYILEHRFVMEKHIGRKLFKNENVHHVNGVKNDNRIENLELWVKVQPCGQRVSDLISFAKEILEKYKDFENI